jgi:hypothetical protein
MPNSPASAVFDSPNATRRRNAFACAGVREYFHPTYAPSHSFASAIPPSLALSDQVAFELCECSHDPQQQLLHRRILCGEGEVLLFEAHMDTALRKAENHLPQIVKVAGKPVH